MKNGVAKYDFFENKEIPFLNFKAFVFFIIVMASIFLFDLFILCDQNKKLEKWYRSISILQKSWFQFFIVKHLSFFWKMRFSFWFYDFVKTKLEKRKMIAIYFYFFFCKSRYHFLFYDFVKNKTLKKKNDLALFIFSVLQKSRFQFFSSFFLLQNAFAFLILWFCRTKLEKSKMISIDLYFLLCKRPIPNYDFKASFFLWKTSLSFWFYDFEKTKLEKRKMISID